MKNLKKDQFSNFNFFPWGYLNTEKYSAQLEDYQISELCNLIITSNEYINLTKDLKLKNLSGRNKNQYLIDTNKDLINDNELLHISISVLDSEKEELDLLSVNVTTNYTGTKKGNINQELVITKSSNTPKFLDLYDFTKIIPAKIKYFRLGLLKYKSKFISSTFGLAPSITGQLLLEITANNFKFEFREEGLKSPEERPWKDSNLVDSILRGLSFYGCA